MKKNLIIVVCLIASTIAFGHGKPTNDSTPAEFKGSKNIETIVSTDNSLLVNKYLKEYMVIPSRVAECGYEGTEIVQFTVTREGNVSNFKVVNSVCPELDNEVIKVLKNTNGMWKPGFQDGEPVATTKEVSFMFGDRSSETIATHFTNEAAKFYRGGNKNLFVKNKPEKAIKYYNLAIRYLPNDPALLSMRGICYYELGNVENAKKDWNRVAMLGGTNAIEIDYDLANMAGYAEMTEILAKTK